MIILAGAGRMGFAMLSRWLDRGMEVCVFDPNPTEQLLALQRQKSFLLNPSNLKGEAEALVLAVKPDLVLSVVSNLQKHLSTHSVLISIAAGFKLAPILETLGHLKVGAVRAMPNMAARTGQGLTALYVHPQCSSEQRVLVEKLMGTLGQVELVKKETEMDAITVLSGCGPAYLLYLAEILTKAGITIDLEQDQTQRIVSSLFVGTTALLTELGDKHDGAKDIRKLREEIITPGGMTEAAFKVLLKDERVEKIFIDAFKAALNQSKIGK